MHGGLPAGLSLSLAGDQLYLPPEDRVRIW
jgi:hypothetical protein